MANHLSPMDIKEIDDKRQSTLSTATDDQTTAAPTPNRTSVIGDKEIKADHSSNVEEKSDQDFQGQEIGEDMEKNGEDLQRVESSMYPAAFKLLFILVSVCLAVFLVALDMTIVATAIPEITDQFNSLTQVGWYGSGFFLTLASFQSTWGKAYKYFPLKSVFLFSIFWFEIGSLICAVAQNSTTLIVGRAIAGLGGAGISSGAYTIIALSVTPNRQPAFTGILGAVFSIASVVGPLLGGVFTTDVTWRWCFYINLPIGGLSAALIFFFFQTPKQAKPVAAELKEKILQLDLPGSFVFMGAVICFLLALQWGGATKPWGSSDVIGTLVGGAVIFLVFVAIEIYQNERALLVRRLLANKTIALACVFQFFNSGAFMTDLYFLPEYFQSVSGVSAAQSGVRNLPFILGISLLTIASGVAITVTGHYIPAMILGTVLSSVGTGLIYTFHVGSSSGEWIGYQALAGIGIGIVIQVPIIVAQSTVEPTDLSSATAMLLFFQTLAGAIFISVAQGIFSNELVQAVAKNAPSVNASQVVLIGATDIRNAYPPNIVPQIVQSFMDALKNTYILAVACAGLSAVVAIAIAIFDWRTLKGAKVSAAA
ncbi:MAG: hypothetical protein M1821_006303 [Bathelium mastoideum]|nr:MAG: hypothetical protein M1821_006303 [Bathelium mastoideum]KAI9686647.1 MAG: hypothetical protein M1822_003658 [Bathelium mastoideum]